MVWITNLLSSPFIQPSVGHFGNLISSHEVLPKCMSRRRMKGEERKGKDSWRLEVDSWLIPTVDWSLKTKLLKAFLILDLRSPWEVVNGWKSSRNLYSLSSSTHIHIRFTHDNRRLGFGLWIRFAYATKTFHEWNEWENRRRQKTTNRGNKNSFNWLLVWVLHGWSTFGWSSVSCFPSSTSSTFGWTKTNQSVTSSRICWLQID